MMTINEILSELLRRPKKILIDYFVIFCFFRLSTTEERLNDGSGRIGELIGDTAGETHSLSCGTPDRGCNEEKYQQEALDFVESFHRRDTHREESEVKLAECSSSSHG